MLIFQCSNCHGTGKVPNAQRKEFERRFFEISNDDLTPLVEKQQAWKEVKALYADKDLKDTCSVCGGVGITKIGSRIKAVFFVIVLIGAIVDALYSIFKAQYIHEQTGNETVLIVGFILFVLFLLVPTAVERGLSKTNAMEEILGEEL